MEYVVHKNSMHILWMILSTIFFTFAGLTVEGAMPSKNPQSAAIVLALTSVSISLLSISEAIAGKQEKSKREGDRNG